MATTYGAAQGRSVSIGRAINNTFATIAANPVATLGLSFLFGAIPAVTIGYFSQQVRGPLIQQVGFGAILLLFVGAALIGMIFSLLAQATLVVVTVAHIRGERRSIGQSLLAALRVVPLLIPLALLIAAATGLASLLLLVPGIMLYTMWCLAPAAMVAERTGVIGSLGRSAYLTKGARWGTLGLLALILLMSFVAGSAMSIAAMAIYGGPVQFAQAMRGGYPLWYLALQLLVQTGVTAVWGTALAALYVELRDWKDGPASDMLAEVFA